MRIVIQRVLNASVTVDMELVSEISKGYLLLVGINCDDNKEIAKAMAKKVVELRIGEDENHKMNLSLQDIKGEVLSVSQFTLYADCQKGRRPSFVQAARPEAARELYEYFNEELRKYDVIVKTGVFQADMKVSLLNDGPVTIILDSDEILKKKVGNGL